MYEDTAGNCYNIRNLILEGSAKRIAEEKLEGSAAIASRLAAQLYGLQILEEAVEDDKSNYTRFLVLSRFPSVPESKGSSCKL